MISLHDGWNGVKYSRQQLSHTVNTFYHEFVLHKQPSWEAVDPSKVLKIYFFIAFTHKPEVEWRLLKRNHTVLVYKIKDSKRPNQLTNTAMKEGRLNWLAHQSVAQHAFVAEFPVVLCKNFSNPLQRKKKTVQTHQSHPVHWGEACRQFRNISRISQSGCTQRSALVKKGAVSIKHDSWP